MKYFVLLTLFISNLAISSNAWENYLNLPSSENAALVVLSPANTLNERDLEILNVQVLSGDLEALKLAFRLKEWLKLAAATSEGLSKIIGRSVRSFPEKFLLAIQLTIYSKSCMVVTNYGYEYIDRISAQLYENTKRIESLSTVNNDTLRNIREVCLSKLIRDNKQLHRLLGS